MPKAVFEHLKRVWVSGRQLRISRTVESSSAGYQDGNRPAFDKRTRNREERAPGPKRRPK